MGLDFSSLCGDGARPGVDIDIGNSEPNSDEKAVYEMVVAAEENKEAGRAAVEKNLEEYDGCQAVIKKAIENPGPESELEAFEELLGAVASISSFYEYSLELDKVFKKLMEHLADAYEGNPSAEVLVENPALATKLANILDFALGFDSARMMKPSLSNDFSYYRRLAPKHAKHPDIKVKDEAASTIALFTAQHIPMLSTVIKAAQSVAESGAQHYVTTVLGIFANSMLHMLQTNPEHEQAQVMRRAMAGALIVFDHVDMLGVFRRSSGVAVKKIVVYLKRENEQGLLGSIRYSSKSFENAPNNIQNLFD